MAQKIVQDISPIYGEAYVVLWLIQVIGAILDEMDEWSSSLGKQVVPQTATWSLPYWEEQYKIITSPDWDADRRRQNIVNKCKNRAPINPYKMESIASVAAGASARVEELTGKNKFTVYLSTKKDLVDENYVKREIDKAKPAHLIYEIIYERYIEAVKYLGGIIQTTKEVTLKQY